MKWILLGALLALLLVYPQLLAVVVAWLVSKPVVVAFALGLFARSRLPRLRRTTR